MMSAMEKMNLGRGNGRAVEMVYTVRRVVTLKGLQEVISSTQLSGVGTIGYHGQNHNKMNLISSIRANSKWVIDLNLVKHLY